MKLSICMMVCNEEENLARCLDSLQSLRQSLSAELIIVDTGSDDNTVNIAKKYTDKVYFHPWGNDFSAMRNISISYAQGEWILIIDADEELEDETNIIKFLQGTESSQFDSAYIIIRSVTLEAAERHYSSGVVPRLFKNDGDFRYTGVIHEQPKFQRIFELNATFKHYGYVNNNKELMERKFARNAQLLKDELAKSPDNIYYRFQLSCTFRMHGDLKEALWEAQAAYKLMQAKERKLQSDVYLATQLVVCLLDHAEYEEAQEVCERALKLETKHLDLNFYMGRIKGHQGNYKQAIEYYLKYLDLVEKYRYRKLTIQGRTTLVTLDKGEEAYLDLAICYFKIHKYTIATQYLDRLQSDEQLGKIFELKIQLAFALQSYHDLKVYYDQVVMQKDNTDISTFLAKLEGNRSRLNVQEQLALDQEFAKGTDQYARFNQIRVSFEPAPKTNNMFQPFLDNLEFNSRIYSDLIYYLLTLKQKDAVIRALAMANMEEIDICLECMAKNHNNLSTVMISYLKQYGSSETFEEVRIHMLFLRYILTKGYCPEASYEKSFYSYMKIGLVYLTTIYTQEALHSEITLTLRSEEDAFLTCLYLAEQPNVTHHQYLALLRKALQIFPIMRKGVEILLEKRRLQVEQQQASSKELAVLGQRLKYLVREMVNSGQLAEAMPIIKEYKNIIKNDMQIEELEAEIIMKLGLSVSS